MNPQRSESSSLKKNQLGKKLENYQIQKLVSKNQNENMNPQVNNIFSASKSQANITINNFAKFSSSGYTNNNFLLMTSNNVNN
jgi:hypothetical protein